MVATGKTLIGNRFTALDASGKLKPGGFMQWLRYSQGIPVRSASYAQQ
ncbi:MAG: hypothetical protein ACJAY7_001317 [Pseudohongiellaceae bacterium]|jgi:hypothetical protein